MSRRSSRKSDNPNLENGTGESDVTAIATPKKGRKAVKAEAVEVVAKVENTPKKSTKKKVKAEESDEEIEEAPKESPARIKINKVKAKAVLEAEKEPNKPKKAPAKRKAKNDGDEEEADDTKTKKKRKTKEEKEAEAMPLAARTVTGTLKKAMYIGAHVSGAGGKLFRYCFLDIY
jgi:AP endonuclease-1